MFEHIRYHEADDVATITIDRPAKKNALTRQMLADIRACWEQFDAGGARVAILASASDEIFSAGADLTDPPADFWTALPEFGFRTDKPIIAAVNGKAIGIACVLVSMCDFCVMSEDATLIYPEARIGLAKGAVSALARRMPLRLLNEMMLLGEPIGAQRAYAAGIVNRVTPAGGHIAAAHDIARTLCANAPLVIEMLKRMTLDAVGTSPIQDFTRMSDAIDKVGNSQDAKDALAAFRNKTKPVFRGR